MPLRGLAQTPDHWTWYQRLRRELTVWTVVAATVGLGAIAVGLSIGLVVSRGESSDSLPPQMGGVASESHPSPSAALAQPLTSLGPTATASPRPAPVSPSPSLPPPPPPPPAPTPPLLAAPLSAAGPVEQVVVVSGVTESTQRLLALVNDERTRVGVGALALDGALMAAAQAHAESMAGLGVVGHELGGGPSLRSRAESAGYVGWSALGENIAWGASGPQEVVSLWLASPSHRANLLSPSFRDVGVGHAISGETEHYWVLILGAR